MLKNAIDRDTYDERMAQLNVDLARAEMELNAATLDAIDVDAVLGFSEHLLRTAARVWLQASPPQRQRMQAVFFPEGLAFDGKRFGTAVTCFAFSELQGDSDEREGLASHADETVKRSTGLFPAVLARLRVWENLRQSGDFTCLPSPRPPSDRIAA